MKKIFAATYSHAWILTLIPLVFGCTTVTRHVGDSKTEELATGVEQALLEHRSEFRQCYDAEAARNPALSGKVVAAFTIAEGGRAVDPKVQSTTLKNSKVEACLLQTLQSIQYPSPENGASLRINYPFAFSSKRP